VESEWRLTGREGGHKSQTEQMSQDLMDVSRQTLPWPGGRLNKIQNLLYQAPDSNEGFGRLLQNRGVGWKQFGMDNPDLE